MMRLALAGRGVESWAERSEVRAAAPRPWEVREIKARRERTGRSNFEVSKSNVEDPFIVGR